MKTLHEAIERVIQAAGQMEALRISDSFTLWVNDGEIELRIHSHYVGKQQYHTSAILRYSGNKVGHEAQQIDIDDNGKMVSTYNSPKCPDWIPAEQIDQPDRWAAYIEEKDFRGRAIYEYDMRVHNTTPKRRGATK